VVEVVAGIEIVGFIVPIFEELIVGFLRVGSELGALPLFKLPFYLFIIHVHWLLLFFWNIILFVHFEQIFFSQGVATFVGKKFVVSLLDSLKFFFSSILTIRVVQFSQLKVCFL
jgi:hypothetical protein